MLHIIDIFISCGQKWCANKIAYFIITVALMLKLGTQLEISMEELESVK